MAGGIGGEAVLGGGTTVFGILYFLLHRLLCEGGMLIRNEILCP